jgi:hypothetical protein
MACSWVEKGRSSSCRKLDQRAGRLSIDGIALRPCQPRTAFVEYRIGEDQSGPRCAAGFSIRRMSAQGQARPFGDGRLMSGLPPKAAVEQTSVDVHTCANRRHLTLSFETKEVAN